jgi:hypothetical protein
LAIRLSPEPHGEVWKNYFDVVILPPPDIRDYAIELSKRLRKYGSKFVLGKRRYIPHISLYHIPVTPQNFQPFCDAVENVAANIAAGELRLKNVQLPLLMTEKPAWLRKLHLDVVRNTNRFFDWDYGAEGSISTERFVGKRRVQGEEYREKYGSPLIGALFQPHITLTSFEDKSVMDDIPPLPLKPASFRVDAIHICELGPSHSCQRIVARFPVLM